MNSNGSTNHFVEDQFSEGYGQNPVAIAQPTVPGPPLSSSVTSTSNNTNNVPAASGQTPMGMVRKKLGQFVGFANLPDQVRRKSVR